MEDIKWLINIAIEKGTDIVKEISVRDIVLDFRTTYKCFTCEKYGKVPLCPPNIPDVDYFERLLKCYNYGLLVIKKYTYHNETEYENSRSESGVRIQKILLFMEQQAFQRNYYWNISFTGGSCRMCGKVCSTDSKVCKNKEQGRIPLEAIGVDVMKTCKNMGVDISPFPHPTLNHNEGILYRVGLFLLE